MISSGKAADLMDCHLINGAWVGLRLNILSACKETVEPVPVTSTAFYLSEYFGKNLPIIAYQMSLTALAAQQLQNKAVSNWPKLPHFSLPL